jgi:ABC-type Fe3+-siderophore transport system permease subunit
MEKTETIKINEIKQMFVAIIIFLVVVFFMSQKIQAMSNSSETSQVIKISPEIDAVEKRKYDLPTMFQIH